MSRFPDQVIKAKPFDLGTKKGAMDFGNWVLGLGVEPDILINNAGTFQPGRVIDEPEGQLENMLQVNLFSAYHLTRVLLPSMMNTKEGTYIQYQFDCCSSGLSKRRIIQHQQICSYRILKKFA